MSKVDVIILAGAAAGAELSPSDANISRAMVTLGDKTMLAWVVDALRGSQSVGRIVAVGRVSADGLDAVVEPGSDLVTNIKLGIDSLEPGRPVLIACSDIPLLTSEAVEDFIDRAERLDAGMAYPIIPRAHCEARYPSLKRTYVRTADGVFTGGNILLVSPEFVAGNLDAISEAYAARKSVVKLARMTGFGVLARVMLARLFPSVLRVSMLEQSVSRMLRAKVAAVVSAFPEIGEDVDKPSDLEAVRRILGGGCS